MEVFVRRDNVDRASDIEIGRRRPSNYYWNHIARVQRLANEATTPAVKEHLQDMARQYERMAAPACALLRRERPASKR